MTAARVAQKLRRTEIYINYQAASLLDEENFPDANPTSELEFIKHGYSFKKM